MSSAVTLFNCSRVNSSGLHTNLNLAKKYKDLSYLQWLFNQTNIKSALKYIDEDENMNLRFRQGVNL